MDNKWITYVYKTPIDDVLEIVKLAHDAVSGDKSSIPVKKAATEMITGICTALVAKVEQDLKDAEVYAAEWAGIPHGYRPSSDSDMDGGQLWWCFPASFDDDAIADKLYNNGRCPGGYWSGPGRAYAHRIYVERHKTRVIVTQSVGFDI